MREGKGRLCLLLSAAPTQRCPFLASGMQGLSCAICRNESSAPLTKNKSKETGLHGCSRWCPQRNGAARGDNSDVLAVVEQIVLLGERDWFRFLYIG